MRIAAAFPVNRIVDGFLSPVPFALTWCPSKTHLAGLLTVDDNRKRTVYYLVEVACPSGRLWAAYRRDTRETHYVRLDAMAYSCDCRGYTRFHHCRHADAVAWLNDNLFLKVKKGLYSCESE